MLNVLARDGWKHFRLLPVVMALSCLFLWSAIFARHADVHVAIDKDWLLLYLCGIEAVHPGLHEQQIDLVKQIVGASGDDQAVYRATLRANYCNNYPFTSLSIYLAGKWQGYFGVSADQDFPAFLARALWYGIFVSGAVLGALFLLTMFILAKGPLRTAVFIAIGVGAICYVTISPPRTNWFLFQGTPAPPAMIVNWPNVLALGVHSWLQPGAAYSTFSVFPRCLCALLSFAAFVFRWSGRPALAYWIVLLVSGIHQSTALLLLLALVGCDIVIRPRKLTRASILVPISVSILIILLRERMFATLGFASPGFTIIVAAFVCLILVLATLRQFRAAFHDGWSFIAARRDRTIAAVPLPFADALIIFAAWLVLILASYLASRNDAWYRVMYFWSELSPRYIGMFQLPALVGVLYPLIVMIQSTRPAMDRVITASLAVLMLTIATSQTMPQLTGLASQTNKARTYDQATSLKKDVYASSIPTMRDETTWYYMLVRNALLGDRSVSEFFGKTR